ncbi:hypothetical protein PRBEI_2001364400 [Prionailurus iriomotensis]
MLNIAKGNASFWNPDEERMMKNLIVASWHPINHGQEADDPPSEISPEA